MRDGERKGRGVKREEWERDKLVGNRGREIGQRTG